jgi:hypothetical protein
MLDVKKVFEELIKAKTLDEVDGILDKLGVDSKYRIDTSKYPKLDFTISKDEIKALKSDGIISNDGHLVKFQSADPLAKLLYAVIWKNGDLKKLKPVIEGILSDNNSERDEAPVFYQFGKHLNRPEKEPIVDQHVIRAFAVYKALKEGKSPEDLYRLSSLTKENILLIREYKHWLRNSLTEELRSHADYAHYVDKVLFALGRSIKVTKKMKLK